MYIVGNDVSVDANLAGTDNNAISIFGYNVTDLCAGTSILFRFCLKLVTSLCAYIGFDTEGSGVTRESVIAYAKSGKYKCTVVFNDRGVFITKLNRVQ